MLGAQHWPKVCSSPFCMHTQGCQYDLDTIIMISTCYYSELKSRAKPIISRNTYWGWVIIWYHQFSALMACLYLDSTNPFSSILTYFFFWFDCNGHLFYKYWELQPFPEGTSSLHAIWCGMIYIFTQRKL